MSVIVKDIFLIYLPCIPSFWERLLPDAIQWRRKCSQSKSLSPKEGNQSPLLGVSFRYQERQDLCSSEIPSSSLSCRHGRITAFPTKRKGPAREWKCQKGKQGVKRERERDCIEIYLYFLNTKFELLSPPISHVCIFSNVITWIHFSSFNKFEIRHQYLQIKNPVVNILRMFIWRVQQGYFGCF